MNFEKNDSLRLTTTKPQIAKPLHIQRLELALDINPFMEYAQNIISQPLSSEDEDDNYIPDRYSKMSEIEKRLKLTKEERIEDKKQIFNLSSVGQDRQWLQNIVLSDSDATSVNSDDEIYIPSVLQSHTKDVEHLRKYYGNSNNQQFGYYSTGLLSNEDMWPEHQKSIVGNKKRKRERAKKQPKTTKMTKKQTAAKLKQNNDDNSENESVSIKGEADDFDTMSFNSLPMKLGRGRTKKANAKTPEMMTIKRRKLWQLMAKKVVGKVQRMRMNNHKEMLSNCKKVAQMCVKHGRQRAMQSQKIMKETVWRAKRLTREMQAYWKRYDRVERETKRRMEKEAEEQRKIDVEIVEAKRQQRKLNFLITQTELYAHFMSKKLGRGSEEEQLRILSQLDEETNPRLAAIDDYNCEFMKQKAQKYASEAFNIDRTRTKLFDSAVESMQNAPTSPVLQKTDASGRFVDLPQPSIFKGVLKGYQLKGMTWLANLYDQGISGILADEMGLGKTVQSIAFLCHIAETYGVYGPFLIISPASTLHNWQQEMQRFVPNFKVVPYWGSPNERKILRQFWEQKDMHTKDASFHVVITSYQLVVSDYKYFNRIKWQYMVLDEAQAIKSSSSVRWKLLLGFNCRNRLLLSGTPIQNSMAELWALLHFIMPTLFDSHEEFNEWFSKDIESHAENKTGIDEEQISRLHMILKPFMLRRIKKDVENELSDKIEIMVYCPLTTRQKLLYVALRKKIRIEDLLKYTGHGNEGHSYDKNFTSNLMNLVMQFRKVCNHPELFERRDAKSPFSCKSLEYVLPRLIFDEGILSTALPSIKHLLYDKFSVYNSVNVERSNFDMKDRKMYDDWHSFSSFSFSRFCNLSSQEVQDLAIGNLIYFFKHVQKLKNHQKLLHYRAIWWNQISVKAEYLLLEPTIENKLNTHLLPHNSIMHGLMFTGITNNVSTVYKFYQHHIISMQETMEHRIIRSKIKCTQQPHANEQQSEESKGLTSPSKAVVPSNKNVQSTSTLVQEIPFIERPIRCLECQPTDMPKFLYGLVPRVQCPARKLYCDSRAAAWAAIRYEQCDNIEGWNLMNDGVALCRPSVGWSNIMIPDKQTLVSDAGKLAVLDSLLTRLKANGHRVLIYSQMTKMIDLLEEYMWHRKHRYMRLDGSSKISARRDMVADFQNRSDIFVFLLSTRAGGLGINLTAADTVIFYDSDWNPTVDQQAMDRAHRLGQTKQVTVYRLICKNTIEQRILQRAREKSEIQRMVISGGNFKPDRQDPLNPNEVASLLLEDHENKGKSWPLIAGLKLNDTFNLGENPCKKESRKRGRSGATANAQNSGVARSSACGSGVGDGLLDAHDLRFLDSNPSSPESDTSANNNDTSKIDSMSRTLLYDYDNLPSNNSPGLYTYDGVSTRRRHHPRGTRRGRPRGSRGAGRGRGSTTAATSGEGNTATGAAQVPDVPVVKRGPGRPRLTPRPGPSHVGTRGRSRGRKAVVIVPDHSPKFIDKPIVASVPSISSSLSSNIAPAPNTTRRVRFNLTPSILTSPMTKGPPATIAQRPAGNRMATATSVNSITPSEILNQPTKALTTSNGQKLLSNRVSTTSTITTSSTMPNERPNQVLKTAKPANAPKSFSRSASVRNDITELINELPTFKSSTPVNAHRNRASICLTGASSTVSNEQLNQSVKVPASANVQRSLGGCAPSTSTRASGKVPFDSLKQTKKVGTSANPYISFDNPSMSLIGASCDMPSELPNQVIKVPPTSNVQRSLGVCAPSTATSASSSLSIDLLNQAKTASASTNVQKSLVGSTSTSTSSNISKELSNQTIMPSSAAFGQTLLGNRAPATSISAGSIVPNELSKQSIKAPASINVQGPLFSAAPSTASSSASNMSAEHKAIVYRGPAATSTTQKIYTQVPVATSSSTSNELLKPGTSSTTNSDLRLQRKRQFSPTPSTSSDNSFPTNQIYATATGTLVHRVLHSSVSEIADDMLWSSSLEEEKYIKPIILSTPPKSMADKLFDEVRSSSPVNKFVTPKNTGKKKSPFPYNRTGYQVHDPSEDLLFLKNCIPEYMANSPIISSQPPSQLMSSQPMKTDNESPTGNYY